MKTRSEQDLSVDDHNQAALTFKRYVRSSIRADTHLRIFKKAPALVPALNFARLKSPRLIRIILDLAERHAAISNIIYHWTSISNFESIIRCKAIYGNKSLTENKIKFELNALSEKDVENGDGNLICLCPHFVDKVALVDETKLRNGLMRLTINLDKVRKPLPKEDYNQLFKLYDFLSPPFIYCAFINDDLSVEFKKGSRVIEYQKIQDIPGLEITFDFQNRQYRTYLNYEDAIFYGDLSTINRFCLLKLCELAEKAMGNLVSCFYSYLDSLSDQEIMKIFVIFSQGLTIFSEYNFNGALNLTDGLLTELYFANDNKRLILSNEESKIDGEFFRAVANSYAYSPVYQAVATTEEIISDKTLYGKYIFNRECVEDAEITSYFFRFSADLFDGKYIETRPGRESEELRKKSANNLSYI